MSNSLKEIYEKKVLENDTTTDLGLKRMSTKFFEYQPLLKYVIDSYNEFIENGINDIFVMNPIRYNTEEGEVFIQISKSYICPPSLGDMKCKDEPMWPNMCRKQKLDYVASLMVNIDFYLNGELIKEEKNVFLTYLPVMLGSQIDNLIIHKLKREDKKGGSKKEPKIYADVEECSLDPLGYFIMNGTEKVLITQEKLATNMMFVLPEKNNDTRIVCEMRSEGPDGNISLIKIAVATPSKENAKETYLTVSLPFIKNKNKEMNIVNLIRLILLLSGETDSLNTAIDMFQSYLEKFTIDVKMAELIQRTIDNAMLTDKEETFMSKILQDIALAVEEKNINEEEKTEEEEQQKEEEKLDDETIKFKANDNDYEYMNKEIKRHFFPHIQEENLHSKMMTLAMMTIRLMKTYFSYKPVSNRDHYGVKRLESPGILVHSLFMKTVQIWINHVSENAPKKNDTEFRTVLSIMNSRKDRIWKDIRGSFVKESWGVKDGKQKTGVCQVMSRLSLNATYSYLRTVAAPSNKSGKVVKPRMIDPTQWRVVCPVEISEGEACGLTKRAAVSLYITLQDPVDNIMTIINISKNLGLITDDATTLNTAILTLNGAYVGYANGPKVRESLIQARRSRKIPLHTSVTLVTETDAIEKTQELKIFTTKGRAVTPLYIVENNQLLYKVKNIDLETSTFADLVNAGVVEYVDVTEGEYLLIAVTPSDLLSGKNFTHCEIDPSFQLSVTPNTMALTQHNPLPRASYTSGMLKQNVSVPMSSYQHRPDTGVKILRYPQKALLQTDIYKIIGLDKQPGSQIVNVAVMALGYNQEDAVIINKAAIERGLFNSDAYDIYTVDIEKQKREELTTTSKYPDFIEGIIPLRSIKYRIFDRYRPIDKKYTQEELSALTGPLGEVVKIVKGFNDEGKPSWIYTIKKPIQIEGKYETKEIIRDPNVDPDLFPEDFEKQGAKFIGQELRDGKIVYTIKVPVYVTEETPVTIGDVLAVKTSTSKQGEKMESHTYMAGKRGVVDRIFRKNKGPSSQTVKIRIRTSHFVEVGDKVCAPYAQKGVVGAVYESVDMPFTSDGLIPDVIINPHAFPSRMTIGMLLEILIGKTVTCSSKLQSGPHIIPTNILQTPILSIKGKKYSQLSTQEKKLFDILYSDNEELMSLVLSNTDFDIPEKIAMKMYDIPNKKEIKISDLPASQQKVYNLLHRRKIQEKKEKFCDATAFRSVDMNSVSQELKNLGYQPHGNETLYSGRTGKRLNAQIFTGVCNYMALKHMVEEKLHARSTGKRQPINRQATRGKSRNGGIRFGEMESDAIKSHGGTGIIQARLRDDSDIYNTYACKRCGQSCYFNSQADEYICNMCEDEVLPTKTTIPYSFHMLKNYWLGMGIKTTMTFGKNTDIPDVVRSQLKK